MIKVDAACKCFGVERSFVTARYHLLIYQCCNFSAEQIKNLERYKSGFGNLKFDFRRWVEGIGVV